MNHHSPKNKILFLIMLLIEIGIIAIMVNNRANRLPVNIYYTQNDLEYTNGNAGSYIDTSCGDIKLTTPSFILPKGMYTLTVRYEYSGLAKMNISYSDGRYISNISGDILASPENEIRCDFTINYANRPMQVYGMMRGDSSPSDYLSIKEIIIEDSPVAVLNFAFRLICITVLIDILAFIILTRKRWHVSKENQTVAKALLVIILFSSLPLMVNYLPWSGHDLNFHLMRIEGLKAGLQSGMFPVKIQPNWLYGHGYAVSVFYGDLFLYIPAFLRLFGISIQTAYQIYMLLVNAATVFIAYWCFYKMSNKRIGVICSALYALNIYRLTCLYTRAAVGEYTAMIFLPMILYGFWRIYHHSEDSIEHKRSWLWIVLGCSGVLHSHLISCELVAVFVILACIILWRKTFRKKTFLLLAKSVVGIILLNLWFLVPFLDYMSSGTYIINAPGNWVDYRIDERGSFLAQLFVTSYNVTAGSFGHEIGMAGEMPQTLGAASLVLLCAWFILYTGKQATDKTLKQTERICILFLLFSLLLSTHLIPYTKLAELFPILKFPERSIQYVWRFLSLAGLFMAWLACILLQNKTVHKNRRIIIAIAIISITFWQSLSMMSDVLNKNNPLRIYQEGNLTTCEVSGGEYLPVGYQLSDYKNEVSYNEHLISVTSWTREDAQIHLHVQNKTSEIQEIEVPFLYYKGYCALDENGNEMQIDPGTSGRVCVSIPPEYTGTFHIQFAEPWYWRLFELVSLLYLCSIIATPIIRKLYSQYLQNNASKTNAEI